MKTIPTFKPALYDLEGLGDFFKPGICKRGICGGVITWVLRHPSAWKRSVYTFGNYSNKRLNQKPKHFVVDNLYIVWIVLVEVISHFLNDKSSKHFFAKKSEAIDGYKLFLITVQLKGLCCCSSRKSHYILRVEIYQYRKIKDILVVVSKNITDFFFLRN